MKNMVAPPMTISARGTTLSKNWCISSIYSSPPYEFDFCSSEQPQLDISFSSRLSICCHDFFHLVTTSTNDCHLFNKPSDFCFPSAFWALIKNHHSKSPHSSKIATDAIVKVPAVNNASTSSPQTIANPLHSANSAAIFTISSSILPLLSPDKPSATFKRLFISVQPAGRKAVAITDLPPAFLQIVSAS